MALSPVFHIEPSSNYTLQPVQFTSQQFCLYLYLLFGERKIYNQLLLQFLSTIGFILHELTQTII